MKLRYDAEADAVYIRLGEGAYAYREELDPERRIDHADGGSPIAIELLCVRGGVDIRSLPDKQAISRLLAKHRIDVIAS